MSVVINILKHSYYYEGIYVAESKDQEFVETKNGEIKNRTRIWKIIVWDNMVMEKGKHLMRIGQDHNIRHNLVIFCWNRRYKQRTLCVCAMIKNAD